MMNRDVDYLQKLVPFSTGSSQLYRKINKARQNLKIENSSMFSSDLSSAVPKMDYPVKLAYLNEGLKEYLISNQSSV